jgi:hypothetical protein
MQNSGQAQGWRTAEWGMWGWIETILKLVGVGAGILAFINSDASASLLVGDNPHLAALVVLVLLTLGAFLQLAVRFVQRETVSFGFAILNVLGHLGLLIAVLRVPDQPTLALVFGASYVLGQIVKLQFLRTTGHTEGGSNSAAMLGIAVAQGALYALFAILMLG